MKFIINIIDILIFFIITPILVSIYSLGLICLFILFNLKKKSHNTQEYRMLMIVNTIKYNFDRKTAWRSYLWSKSEYINKTFILALFGEEKFFHYNVKENIYIFEIENYFKSIRKIKITYWTLRYFFAQIMIFLYVYLKNIDMVLTPMNSFYAGITLLFCKYFLGLKYIIYEGTNKIARIEEQFYNNSIVKIIEKINFMGCDAIFTRQEKRLEVMEQMNILQSKVYYIPHYFQEIEVEDIKKLTRPSLLKTPGSPVFFYFGRITVDKRVNIILKSFIKLLEYNAEVILILCGKGEKKLINQIKKNKYYNKKIFILDYLDYNELKRYIIFTDIHIHPTGGKALIESGYFKKPVIVFERYVWDYDLIENNITGITCKFDSEEDMCKKMILLLENEDLRERIGENLYKKIKLIYNYNYFIDKLNYAYSKILKK